MDSRSRSMTDLWGKGGTATVLTNHQEKCGGRIFEK
jgi:hypothetical protein